MISLRPVEPADIDVFYEHQADPEAARMAGFSSRDRAAHLEHWTKRVLANPTGIVRTVVVDGTVAGNVVSWIDEDGRRLLGYWIGREFWGRGVATEAVRIHLTEQTARPVFAYVATPNAGSRRVLVKNGFTLVPDEGGIGEDGVEELLFVLK